MLILKKELQQLLDYLENVHLDEKEEYEIKINGHLGSRTEVLNREQFLEFVIETTIDDVMNLIDILESDAS